MKEDRFESNLKKLISVSYPAEYNKEFKEELFKKMSEELESAKRPVIRFKPFLGINQFSWKMAGAAIGVVFISIIAFFLVNRYNQDTINLKLISGNVIFQNGDIKLVDVTHAKLPKNSRIISSGPALPTIQILDNLQVVMNLDTVLTWKGAEKGFRYRFGLEKGEIYVSLKDGEQLKLFVPSGGIEATKAEFNVKNNVVVRDGGSEKVSILDEQTSNPSRLSSLFIQPAFAEGRGQPELESIVTVKEGEVRIKNAFGSSVIKAGMQAKLLVEHEPLHGQEVDITEVIAWRYLQWKLKIDKARNKRFSEQKLLVAEGKTVFSTSMHWTETPRRELNFKLFAIDAETGEIRWSRIVKNCITKNSIKDGILYVSGWENDYLYRYALDIESGNINWKFATNISRFSMPAPPAVADSKNVYFRPGGKGSLFCALDNKTGELIWEIKLDFDNLDNDKLVKFGIDSVLLVEDKIVVVTSGSGYIFAYNADSGEVLWEYAVSERQEGKIEFQLFLAKESIYAITLKYIYVLDKANGNLKWKKGIDKDTQVLYDENNRKVYFNIENNKFVSFDENTGHITNVVELSHRGNGEIAEEKIYLIDNHLCYITDKQNGTILWKFSADSRLAEVLVKDKKIYLISEQGILYALVEPVYKYANLSEELIKKALNYSEEEKHEKAIELYEKIINEIEPGNSEAWFNLALEFEKVGNTEKARQTWNKCQELIEGEGNELKLEEVIGHLYSLCRPAGASWIKRITQSYSYRVGMQINDGVLYVAGRSEDALYAVDIRGGGNIKWKYKTEEFICGTPIITDGLILIPVFSKGIFAIDRETHALQWQFQTDRGSCSVTIGEGVAFIINRWESFESETSSLSKVDLKTGNSIWQRMFGCCSINPPIISDNSIYIGIENVFDQGERMSHSEVYALNITDGTTKWISKSPAERAIGHMIVGKGILYVTYINPRDKNDSVYAIDKDSGNMLWKIDFDQFTFTPAIYNDTVYIAEMDKIHAFDALTGERKWEGVEIKNIRDIPILYKGMLYVPRNDRIYIINPESGQIILNFMPFYGKELSAFRIEEDIVYAISRDGFLTALPLSNLSTGGNRK